MPQRADTIVVAAGLELLHMPYVAEQVRSGCGTAIFGVPHVTVAVHSLRR